MPELWIDVRCTWHSYYCFKAIWPFSSACLAARCCAAGTLRTVEYGEGAGGGEGYIHVWLGVDIDIARQAGWLCLLLYSLVKRDLLLLSSVLYSVMLQKGPFTTNRLDIEAESALLTSQVGRISPFDLTR